MFLSFFCKIFVNNLNILHLIVNLQFITWLFYRWWWWIDG